MFKQHSGHNCVLKRDASAGPPLCLLVLKSLLGQSDQVNAGLAFWQFGASISWAWVTLKGPTEEFLPGRDAQLLAASGWVTSARWSHGSLQAVSVSVGGHFPSLGIWRFPSTALLRPAMAQQQASFPGWPPDGNPRDTRACFPRWVSARVEVLVTPHCLRPLSGPHFLIL